MGREKKKDIFYGILVAVMAALLLMPLIFMPVAGFQKAESQASQTEFPSLRENGQWNIHFLAELGEYFNHSFAFRNHLITAYNGVMAEVFRTSMEDDVIMGKDGYLFYRDTLDDYQKTGSMDARKIENTVYNLELLEKILDRQGISFVFTIAPNKNSLYGEYMPGRYQKLRTEASSYSNSERFQEQLEGRKLSYVNLFSLFQSHSEELYHKTDSHWNNEGAALAGAELLRSLGRQPEDYGRMPFHINNDFQGDLFHMLYPSCKGSEGEVYYEKKWNYNYDTKISSTFDPFITTTNGKASGTVAVFRDSFGNALLPFIAEEYAKGIFSRAMPVTVEDMVRQGADDVIIEVAERNLTKLQEKAPVVCSMPVKGVKIPKYILPVYDGTMKEEKDGYIHIFGDLDEKQSSVGMKTYLYLEGRENGSKYVLECFREEGSRKDGYGYSAYLDAARFKNDIYDMSLVCVEGDALSRTPVLREIDIHEEQNEDTLSDSGKAEGSAGNEDFYSIATELKGHNIEELIRKIGEPQNFTLGESCLTAGEDGQYIWEDILVYTRSEQKGGEQIIQEVLKSTDVN